MKCFHVIPLQWLPPLPYCICSWSYPPSHCFSLFVCLSVLFYDYILIVGPNKFLTSFKPLSSSQYPKHFQKSRLPFSPFSVPKDLFPYISLDLPVTCSKFTCFHGYCYSLDISNLSSFYLYLKLFRYHWAFQPTDVILSISCFILYCLIRFYQSPDNGHFTHLHLCMLLNKREMNSIWFYDLSYTMVYLVLCPSVSWCLCP